MGFEEGPYVQVACLCDMVLEDKSGAASLIRIIDTLTHTAKGPTPPEEMPTIARTFWLVVMLKSGKAIGRHELTIVPELPSAETGQPIVLSIHLQGDEKGHNVIAQMNYQFQMEGLYWFNVLFDGEKISAIPLRVMYNRVVTTQAR